MAEIRRPELETRRYPRIGFDLRSMGLPRTERQLAHDLADFRCIQPAVGYHRPLHFVGCHLLHGQSPLPLGTGLPWIFLVVMIFWADFLNIFEIYLPKGEWTMFTVSIIMAVLVIIVAIGAIRRCIYLAKTVPASYDTTETVEAEELKHLQELVKTDKAAQRFQELTIAHH